MGEGEQARQIRLMIVIAAVLCAVIIGYNAFYVPDAPLSEPAVTADAAQSGAETSNEEYTPAPVSSAAAAAKDVSEGVSFTGKKSAANTAAKIDINTATVQQLSAGLDGVGDDLAKRIVAYREQHGGFKTIEQLKNVSGIGDKKFNKIRDFVTVG